ncbi:hypothetical protein IKG13_03930 [Candidatus Saccharibacteria bacterium]|nr:hypothetical protein [Candidatus Saccharibacteria bacterium]MBR3378419.1 hypothetical protein [Candidatus Saccharibacteria bacterium]
MKNHLFARIMRASGRLLLFVGAVFGFGLTFLAAYQVIHRLIHPGETFAPLRITETATTGAAVEQGNPYMTIAITIGSVILALFLLGVIARIYNRSMRNIIAKLARLFHAQIFTVEIVSTGIVWTICTLLLVFTIPFLSIITIFAFIVNELLFILAWGAYGQPNYKI